MNPMGEQINSAPADRAEVKSVAAKTPAPVETSNEPIIQTFSNPDDEILDLGDADEVSTQNFSDDEFSNEEFVDEESEPVTSAGAYQPAERVAPAYRPSTAYSAVNKQYDDGAYHITFVEEKNRSGRNILLLGSFLLVTSLALGGMVYSLFNANAVVGALGSDDTLLALINDDIPEIPEIVPPKNDKPKGGGGGGGGSENPEDASKGRLPPQDPKPQERLMIVPTMKDPSLAIENKTQGNIKREVTDENVGIPTGALSDRLSGGKGTGNGIGSGNGSGVGSGRGTGEGSGIGSGSGNGIGNGNGDGRGDGTGGGGEPPAMPPKGPTKAIAILSKPKPPYTDAARQNQITGVVRLRVQFLASGQIGSVTPIGGLPYGLTEQAISAAKSIKFQPALQNGQPVTVSKIMEYNFTIY